MSSIAETVSARASGALLLVLGILLFGVRLAGPPDLTDNDQEGPTAYILDVLQNGHWAVQRDAHGEIASKPPLYTWLAALAALGAGRLDRFTLYLPCALAVVGTSWLALRMASRWFGVVAGLLAGFSILFSQFGLKHVVLARTDALFMATVALGAAAAWRAWETGRGWTAFWFAASAASLTKGPLGIVLAGGGLLAMFWEQRGERSVPSWRRWMPGAALFAVLVGGWFALAYLAAGDALLEKQLGRELVGHLSGASAGGHWPGSQPLHPVAYFLSRFAPWSLLACVGFWRVCRRPAAGAEERRLERFLFCWFFVGLGIFIIAPHKRADLLLPMIPAAAMLAGRELARWLTPVRPVVIWRWAAAVGIVILTALPALSRLKPEASEAEAQSVAMQKMADWIRGHVPPGTPVTFAGNLMTLQFYLNQHQFHTTPEQAARLLQSGARCAVAVAELETLQRSLAPGAPLHVLAREPVEGAARVYLVSNRPTLEAEPTTAAGIGPLAVEFKQSRLLRPRWLDLDLEAQTPQAEVRLVNRASRPVTAGVRWLGSPTSVRRQRTLVAGESWTLNSAGEDPGEKRRRGWADTFHAYDEADRTSPPPREAMLFVGSSSIRLWETLETDFRNYVTIQRGFSGAHLEDVVAEVDRLVFRHEPRLVLVYAGDNDLADGKAPERVLEDFEALVARLHARLPSAGIGFIAIKPSVARRPLLREIRAANELVRAYTSREAGLFYVDIFTPMLDASGEPRPELLVADGLHLNQAGYQLWTQAITNALEGNPTLAELVRAVRRHRAEIF